MEEKEGNALVTGLSEEGTFEQNLEWDVNHVRIWGTSFSGRRNSKCKTPKVV